MTRFSRTVAYFFALTLAAILFSSCRETALHGDFSGQWKVESIDWPDGSSVNPEGTRFYNFYRHVAQLSGPPQKRVTGNLAYDGDARRFSIGFPEINAEEVYPWGIDVPDDVPDGSAYSAEFSILRLDSEHLVFKATDGTVISCRKW